MVVGVSNASRPVWSFSRWPLVGRPELSQLARKQKGAKSSGHPRGLALKQDAAKRSLAWIPSQRLGRVEQLEVVGRVGPCPPSCTTRSKVLFCCVLRDTPTTPSLLAQPQLSESPSLYIPKGHHLTCIGDSRLLITWKDWRAQD